MHMNRKKNKKSSGFFIIEILIVLVIVGILVIAMLPNFKTYTQRAQFIDVLTATDAVRPAVDACILSNGTATNCNASSYGIPAVPTGTQGYFSTYAISAGTITSTSVALFGTNNATAYTYILTPTIQSANGAVTWAATGTCAAAGLC
jgi:type IV pilus assembly protein PilA